MAETIELLRANPHFLPQLSTLEAQGKIAPTVLKIEDGLDAHISRIEGEHSLPRSAFEQVPEVSETLLGHKLTARRHSAPAGPERQCRVWQIVRPIQVSLQLNRPK